MNIPLYCNSIDKYSRFLTREVNIGGVPLGASNPIRIQSMTNTDTMNTLATVAQAIRMIEAGCEYVRITAPGLKEAKNLAVIKRELTNRGYHTPLIADIHFNPKAAELAASIVEKVRINPGNYTDKKLFHNMEFTDAEYVAELEKIHERLLPLLKICREYGTAIRIGTNHGSLSDRIMSRYGDTPLGMAESAMEFIRICETEGFHNLVLSMKSSNVKVMVQATRLLVSKMKAEKMAYPLHLGVTEAGDAEDGRIKSAAGIGTLLADGIGDTIRVSLTEAPEKELSVAKKLVEHAAAFKDAAPVQLVGNIPFQPYTYKKRKTTTIGNVGGNNLPVVITDVSQIPEGVTVLKPDSLNVTANFRCKIAQRNASGDFSPIICKLSYPAMDKDTFILHASADAAPMFVDGLADGLWLEAVGISQEETKETAYGILQATRARFTKTEFIACPSCGRTQFDIVKALKDIKERTAHLPGLKIGVMGCIVNGPGEMADADYGYVGAGNGKITLYKGKEIVRKNIPEADAVDALVQLIKDNGDWR